MSKYVAVPNGDYKLTVQTGGNITLDTGFNTGRVVVTGDLLVQGTTTTVESVEVTITDNIIELNKGEQGNGVSLTESGIKIDRGTAVDVYSVFNEDIVWLDPVTSSPQFGAFTFKDDTGKLIGLKTSSITTEDDQDLFLINSGLGVISVTGTNNYELQVTDDDDIPNKRYVDLAIENIVPDRIIAKEDETTFVWAQSTDLGDSTQIGTVRVVVNNTETARFTQGVAQFPIVNITNEIRTPTDLTLILNPGGVGNVSVSNSRIVSLDDPINDKDAVNLQFLEDKLSTINNIGDVDITNFLQNGAVLVYNSITGNFESTVILQNQIVDGGSY
jgi:hypothetical protein